MTQPYCDPRHTSTLSPSNRAKYLLHPDRTGRRTTPTDKGKLVERRGRKATGLRDKVLRQRGCQRTGRALPLPGRYPAKGNLLYQRPPKGHASRRFPLSVHSRKRAIRKDLRKSRPLKKANSLKGEDAKPPV